MVGRRIQDLGGKKMENLKDKLMFKEKQYSMPLKRAKRDGNSLDSALNRCLNFRWTSKGVVKIFARWIIPAVTNMFTNEKVLR